MAEEEIGSDGKEFLSFLKQAAGPSDYALLLPVCAGRRVWVSLGSPRRSGWMSRAIGFERAREVTRRLNELGYQGGCQVEVPLVEIGIMAQVHGLIRAKVIEGYTSGKNTSVIAAECGISRRLVQIQIAKLRERELLPPPSREQIIAMNSPMLASTAAKQVLGVNAKSDSISVVDGAARKKLAAGGAGGIDRAEAIGALIVRMHGPDITEMILDVVCERSAPEVQFSAAALADPSHPFRRALSERDAKLTAIGVVAIGLGFEASRIAFPGDEALRDRPEDRPMPTLYRRIREQLMTGRAVEDIAASLNVTNEQILGQRRQLRRYGLLLLTQDGPAQQPEGASDAA